MWEKITNADALGLKPAIIPEVEPELLIDSPRPMVWQYPDSSPKKITPEIENLLINGTAVRGWKTLYRTNSDREGTEHYVQYCFNAEDILIHGKNYRSYDDLHLAIESPDYAIWMANAYHRDGTFTILYDPENPVNHEIFGHLELYIKMDLLRLTELIINCKDPYTLDQLAFNFLKISITPLWNIGDEGKIYFHLMENLGLSDKNEVYDSDTNLRIIKEIIPGKKFDMKNMIELSGFCKKHVPGIWAAR